MVIFSADKWFSRSSRRSRSRRRRTSFLPVFKSKKEFGSDVWRLGGNLGQFSLFHINYIHNSKHVQLINLGDVFVSY